MLLNSYQPSRKRDKIEILAEHGPYVYGYKSPWGTLYHDTSPWSLTSRIVSHFEDEKSPRFGFKPCISTRRKILHNPNLLARNWGANLPGDTSICPGREFWGVDPYGHEEWPFFNIDEVSKHQVIQDALEKVLSEYYDSLYNINWSDIPDMTVFLKELPEVIELWRQIRTFAQVLSSLLENIDKRHLRRYKDVQTELVKTIPGDYLVWNFGVLPTIKDVCKLLEAILSKWTSTSFSTYWHKNFVKKVGWRDDRVPVKAEINASSPNAGCDVDHSLIDTVLDGYDCCVAITSRYFTTIEGTGVEKALAAMLGLLGLLPNVSSIWELTKLSWFADHFVRVDKLFRKSGLLSFSPKRATIYDSCCSIKIERTRTFKSGALCRGGELSIIDTYYERARGTQPMENLLDWTRCPSLKQGSLDAAYILQRLLVK